MESGEMKSRTGVSGAWAARLAVALLLAVLLLLTYLVVEDFLVPILWAVILAYVTWPLNCRIRSTLRRRDLAALVMTLLLALVILLPLLLITVSLRQEAKGLLDSFRQALEGGSAALPSWLLSIPLIGERIATALDRVAADPGLVGEWLTRSAAGLAGEAAGVVEVVGRNIMKFGMALLAVFFVYRDGEEVTLEFRQGVQRLLGTQAEDYWDAAAGMIRAVVYGLVLTAIAQGMLAGVGYWFLGVAAPVLFGALTALAALIPFGAPVVWGAVSIYLLWTGSLWEGLALLAWGALAVSSVDNLVRPLVISASARIPFLLVVFGVLGGLNAFGLVGLFLGPTVLAIVLAVWRQWLGRRETVVVGPGEDLTSSSDR